MAAPPAPGRSERLSRHDGTLADTDERRGQQLDRTCHGMGEEGGGGGGGTSSLG